VLFSSCSSPFYTPLTWKRPLSFGSAGNLVHSFSLWVNCVWIGLLIAVRERSQCGNADAHKQMLSPSLLSKLQGNILQPNKMEAFSHKSSTTTVRNPAWYNNKSYDNLRLPNRFIAMLTVLFQFLPTCEFTRVSSTNYILPSPTRRAVTTLKQEHNCVMHVSNQNWGQDSISSADHRGHAAWGINCLRPPKHWDRGFESHSRHECLCAFILRLCCLVCAGSGLATGWSPVQRVLPTV
jgi:hypothetical protein